MIHLTWDMTLETWDITLGVSLHDTSFLLRVHFYWFVFIENEWFLSCSWIRYHCSWLLVRVCVCVCVCRCRVHVYDQVGWLHSRSFWPQVIVLLLSYDCCIIVISLLLYYLWSLFHSHTYLISNTHTYTHTHTHTHTYTHTSKFSSHTHTHSLKHRARHSISRGSVCCVGGGGDTSQNKSCKRKTKSNGKIVHKWSEPKKNAGADECIAILTDITVCIFIPKKGMAMRHALARRKNGKDTRANV